MLIRFWVENYRCFGDRTELDFTDKKNYSFGKGCVRGDYLEKVLITGNNGSGKTSFGYALADIIATLTGFSKDIGQNNENCFINARRTSEAAVFHYEFNHRGTIVVYEYAKKDPFILVSERIDLDGRMVLNYDLSRSTEVSIDTKSLLITHIPDTSGLNGTLSLIRMIGNQSIVDRSSSINFITDFARNTLYYLAMWRMDDHIGQIDHDVKIVDLIVQNHLENDLQVFLKDVCGVDIRLVSEDGTLMADLGGKHVPMLQATSRGTAIMCRLFAWIWEVREKNALIFFDDFDDLFDYRTAESLIGYIIENVSAQCIFVTHNVDLIADENLRPDCCFIMRGYRLRSLSSLTDKTLRRGHNLAKMLRDGVFDNHSLS